MIRLNQLLDFNNIIIQCHDNPDPDTLASGYALYTYLKFHHKNVRLIYSGPNQISKPNLKLMIESLHIPIEYVTYIDIPDLLITVDCQYGEGNIHHFPTRAVCVLDHHIPVSEPTILSDIRPNLTSCSTLIWTLLIASGFNLESHLEVCTALYYGLLTDSNAFTEISDDLDVQMQNTIPFDNAIIKQLKYSNLSLIDLVTAGTALISYSFNPENKFAIFKSGPCDPNILGFISDLVIQVDSIHLCIVYYENEVSIKYSIRSCSDQILANEFAKYICREIGSGGGHIDKAGGQINLFIYKKHFPHLPISNYLTDFTQSYLSHLGLLK